MKTLINTGNISKDASFPLQVKGWTRSRPLCDKLQYTGSGRGLELIQFQNAMPWWALCSSECHYYLCCHHSSIAVPISSWVKFALDSCQHLNLVLPPTWIYRLLEEFMHGLWSHNNNSSVIFFFFFSIHCFMMNELGPKWRDNVQQRQQ